MTDLATVDEQGRSEDERSHQERYNEAAIAHANRLQELRLARFGFDEAADPELRPLTDMLAPQNQSAVGVAQEWERMGHQPVTDTLAAEADGLGIEFEHLGLTVGTVIHGVDLSSEQSDRMIAAIRTTLLERKVVFFRDQNLTEDQQVAFGRRFGTLDAFPFGLQGDNPYILEIVHGERSPGLENGWHSDVTWMERPSLGSIAQCVVVPPVGGDTLFADSHAAYLGMPSALRELADHLDGVNDYRLFVDGRGRGAWPEEVVAELKQQIPFGVTHPIVRTHPETGKQALYLNGGFLRHDSLTDRRTGEPLGPEESIRITGLLLAQHDRPEYQCRFRWEPGSIAFWDNRAVQHYAASDYFPHRRVLRRVTVSGDVPYHRPDAS